MYGTNNNPNMNHRGQRQGRWNVPPQRNASSRRPQSNGSGSARGPQGGNPGNRAQGSKYSGGPQGNNYGYKYPYQNTVNSLKMSGRRVQNYITTGNYAGLSNEIKNSVGAFINSVNKPLYNTSPNPYSNTKYLAGEQSVVGLGAGQVITFVLIIFFLFLMFVFLPVGLARHMLASTIAGIAFAALSAAFVFAFIKCRKDFNISYSYNIYRGAIIASRSEIVSVHRLALTVKKSDETALNDVEKFIDKGLLPQASLSEDKKTLLLSPNALGFYEKSEKYRKEFGVHISNIEKDLNALKNLVPNVNDKAMTEKLYHTVSSVEAILENLKKDNENVKKALTFESYYLPTTVKLVQSFIELEHSKNEENEKQEDLNEISNSIDSINEAFDTLHKNMTEIDTSDVMSDMVAMETMMKQDGLI